MENGGLFLYKLFRLFMYDRWKYTKWKMLSLIHFFLKKEAKSGHSHFKILLFEKHNELHTFSSQEQLHNLIHSNYIP